MPRWMTTLVPILALLGACSGQEGVAERAERETAGQGSAEQRVYIDPETGELSAPPEDRSKQRGDDDPPSKAPSYQREERPDGSVMLRPKQPERHVIEAETDEDGEVTVEERDRYAQ